MPLNLAHFIPAAALGAAAGFIKPLYFISTGYGAAMTLQSALALASGRAAGADLLGRLHLAAVATYGWRMAAFVLWRERLPSFQRRRADSDAKLAGMPLSKKLGMWAGVVPLYSAMFVPAFWNSAAGAGAGASAAATAISLYVGAPLMLGALLWEAVADYQQQMHYERQAASGGPTNKPCTGGLWSLSRQANYFGEASFWLAGYATALRAYQSLPQALGAAVGVAGIVGIIAGESKRRAADKERQYSGPEWEQYKSDTAQIVPFLHCIKTGGAGTAAAPPEQKAK